MSSVPLTDPRRAQALRAALAEMAQWLTPGWAGLDQDGDFGRALYEIAARLGEHSTRRLDQTALRDRLAFLDTLDIAAPQPRSATVPIVFTLVEKRAEPVYAPPRVQVAAASGDSPVMFETREGLAITPARALRLIAADPTADRIELAPPAVIAAPQPGPPPVSYRLVSAAEAGGTMLQLAQAIGLAAGDTLRIDKTAYRIGGKSGEIVTLLDPLEAPAPAGALIEKVARLESYTLRNLSEHVAYVGHKELLKLDGPATIALRLEPPSLARRLTQLDIAYDLWGKPKGADSPSWQMLRLLGRSDGDLRLRKDWEGSVEEVETAGRKSRWIRLRLQSPISDAAPPDTRAASLALKVSSNAPATTEPAEGSRSIVSAFYNGQPLPLTTAFLPFGPEPQRFDTFAIAAPEALSKKGASVELAVGLSDASLGAFAAVTGAPDRVYGIGRNGRLQAIRLDAAGTLSWRQLDRPPASGSGGSSAAPRLDPAEGVCAFQLQAGPPANDLVVARDDGGALWMAALQAQGQDWSVAKWTLLPPPGDARVDSLCLIFTAIQTPLIVIPKPGTFPPEWMQIPGPSLPPLVRLVAADPQGVYAQTLDSTGAALGWQPLAQTASSATPKAPLRLASVAGGDSLVVAIDAGGAIYRGKTDGATIEWTPLAPVATADPAVRPSAVQQGGVVHVVATGGATPAISMVRAGEATLHPPAAEQAAVGRPIALTSLAQPDGSGFPLVAVIGSTGIMIWSAASQATSVPLPSEGEASKLSALLSAAVAGAAPRLILGSPDERILHAAVDSGQRTLAYVKFDLVRVPAGPLPKYWLVEGETGPTELSGTPLRVGNAPVLAVAPGRLNIGGRYSMLETVADGAGSGKRVSGKPRQLRLEDTDSATDEGDFLEIGADLFEVEKVEANAHRVATLAADLPAGTLDYAGYRKGPRRQFGKPDLGTLLNFGVAALPDDVQSLQFAADPPEQDIVVATAQPPDASWVKLQSAWSIPPAEDKASFPIARTLGTWTASPLPRSTENPELSWEYFDGRGWRRLDQDFSDGTNNLGSSGSIRFTVPDDLSQTDVAGKQDYWIRTRLVGGDYGRPSYIFDTSVPNRQSITVDRSTLNPPEIFTIEARYALQTYAAPQLVLTVNNLAAIDQTQAAAAAGAEFELFEGLAAHTRDSSGLGRAIYLGLSRAPAVESLSLYVDAVDAGAAGLRLQAEVLRPEGWAPVVCDDRTAGLARPGLLRLFLSAAPAQMPLFGCDGWWLRLRPLDPSGKWAPIVRNLYLNAVTAEQAKTLRQEILGSSLGAPGQSYRMAEAPVLPETLELRVRESLSDEEKAALTATDPGAVESYPNIEGEWIRWCATDSFVDEGGSARVFRLDSSSGEIRFGDGRDGRIPPAGRDAIRAVGYQAGGGSRGNVPALAVNQLKTALESVELAVNPVDAGGGADAPPNDRLAETAPARLRHAGRALAPPDIEALATGSSPDVVRARCLRGRGCSIDVVVAIRQAGERCPVPSRARREGIARNIAAAGWGALTPESIRVRAPDYVHIRVKMVVVARSADEVAQVENDVRAAIVGFLHPLDGGAGGLGWPFGRRPWPSDLQRVAAAVAGVDRVAEAEIAACDPRADLDRLGQSALVCAEEDAIEISVEPPESAS
ncbi:MAG: hypothetical protein JWO25_940 [Alphaproteobacteria bacterium]|nr:hypothetical protein [Alphaproteobacteria bacterium]